jgi:hypothetical protein
MRLISALCAVLALALLSPLAVLAQAAQPTPTISVPAGNGSRAAGAGKTTPLDRLHVRFTNTNGTFGGPAVQKLGNTPSSFSGTLFCDHAGALRLFQGYNNATQEYRINNIASNGSINFLLGGSSMFKIAPNGRVGIGMGTATIGKEQNNGSRRTRTRSAVRSRRLRSS